MWKLPLFEVEASTAKGIDTAIVAVFQDSKGKALPSADPYGPWVKRLRDAEVFSAKHGSTHFVRFAGAEGIENILFVGLGNPEELSGERLRVAAGHVWTKLNQEKVKTAGIEVKSLLDFQQSQLALPPEKWIRAFAEGLILGAYKFQKYQTKSKTTPNSDYQGPGRLVFMTTDRGLKTQLTPELDQVTDMGEAVCITRDWSNEPSNVGTPTYFADEARKLATANGLKIRVLTPKELAREKMGLLLGVSQGSEQEPRLVIVEYLPKKKQKGSKKIAVVGKGVTFDSGGISIKPATRMEDMKHDMTGAATVMGALVLAARWGVPNHVVGVMAFTENMPDGKAMQPGNILRSRSGKTVEIINTDAEGRLVLADALDFIQDEKPDAIVDVATLTGAVSIALGKQCCAILGNDDSLVHAMRSAAETNGERIWQLPLYDEYFDDLKSDTADMKNSANDSLGGTIRAAAFLKQFIRKGSRWIHLDIAAMAYNLSHLSYYPKRGASGAYVRTIAQFVKDF